MCIINVMCGLANFVEFVKPPPPFSSQGLVVVDIFTAMAENPD